MSEIDRIKRLAGLNENNHQEVLIPGYGRMRRDQLERDATENLRKLLELSEMGNWKSVMYMMNGVLKAKVQTLIDTDPDAQTED